MTSAQAIRACWPTLDAARARIVDDERWISEARVPAEIARLNRELEVLRAHVRELEAAAGQRAEV